MSDQSTIKDEVANLVDIAVDDHYEGSGVNDKTLGMMYYLKRYAKAADEMYDDLRKSIVVPPGLTEETIISNDSRFSAKAQPRSGSSKVDRNLMHSELRALLLEHTKTTPIRASIDADALLDNCTVVTKGSTAVTIIEDKR